MINIVEVRPLRDESSHDPHQSALEVMQTVHGAAGKVRSLLTRDYMGFVDSSATGRCWIEVPGPNVTLIVNLGTPFGGFPSHFVAGLTDSFTFVQSKPGTRCIDVKMSPLGAFRLLGVPMHELSGHVTDLSAVIPSEASVLDGLRDEADWPSSFAALDRLLERRVAHGPQPAAQVSWAWQRMVANSGQVTIRTLAEEVGWSHKHLIVMFKEQLGLRPKTLSRILRFGLVVRRLHERDRMTWADAAAAAGYSDQAHLIRDFKRFTGHSPDQYIRRTRLPTAPPASGR
jgi:AraC-like DNA-binding protein